jgi:uncharacterized protein YqjF (DUF2071 family)
MFNYAVEPSLLAAYVPRGTELDDWNGTTYVSLVGFLFDDTRVFGIAIPGHRTFEEVNLRIYVRRRVGGEVRRAVTFIREVVPRRAIAFVARAAYNEPYVALPMRHRCEAGDVSYGWRLRGGWAEMRARPVGPGAPLVNGSHEEFITEHFWGYTKQRDGATIEYRVEHPRWNVSPVADPLVTGDLEELYGRTLAAVLMRPPSSAFVGDGSAVTVYSPTRIAEKA